MKNMLLSRRRAQNFNFGVNFVLCLGICFGATVASQTGLNWTAHFTPGGRLAERHYNSTGHVDYCLVFTDRKVSESALGLVPREGQFLVDEGNFERIVSECPDSIDINVEKGGRVKRQITFIYPGTKWCGLGSVANSFHDVGREQNTDVCCRNHDQCPINILRGETKYNLTNNNLGTMSSCACERQFHACLRGVDTRASASVGSIYFNGLRLPCIEESHPEKCSGWWIWKSCRKLRTERKRLTIVQSKLTF